VIIFLWAVWALLDAFVIPRDIVAVEEAGAVPVETADARPAETADIQPAETADTEPADSTGPEANLLQGNDSEALSEPEHEKNEYWKAEPGMDEAPAAALDEPVITDHSYDDGFTRIEISTMRMLDTDIYIADVEITDPSLLSTALAEGAFGRNLTEPTSVIAERNDAIFAVNGDYYGFRSTGYVMRNGYLYRSVPAKDPDQEDLVPYENGSIDILREADITAEEIRDSGASDIFSFGPGLVTEGEITVSRDDEVERAQVTNPRTAIGLLSPLHYLFVVSDGRTDESVGLSLYELAGLMKDLGCVTAYNLDGGGSSTMWFNGRVLNRPTTFGDKIEERSVSDIVYIGKQ
jgi:exopolysaccharide biosynthesis protein